MVRRREGRRRGEEGEEEEEEEVVKGDKELSRTLAPLLRTARMMTICKGEVQYPGEMGEKHGSHAVFHMTKAFGRLPKEDLVCGKILVAEPVEEATKMWRMLTDEEAEEMQRETGTGVVKENGVAEGEADDPSNKDSGGNLTKVRAAEEKERKRHLGEEEPAPVPVMSGEEEEVDVMVQPGGQLPTQIRKSGMTLQTSHTQESDDAALRELFGDWGVKKLWKFGDADWMRWNEQGVDKILSEAYWAGMNVDKTAVIMRFCWNMKGGSGGNQEAWIQVAEMLENAGASVLIFVLPDNDTIVPYPVLKSNSHARDLRIPVVFMSAMHGRHLAIRSVSSKHGISIDFSKAAPLDFGSKT